MGRVYKALLKVDGLVDAGSAIGRPVAEYDSAQTSQKFSHSGVSSEFARPFFAEPASEWRIQPEAAPISSEELGLINDLEPPQCSMVYQRGIAPREEVRPIAPVPKQQESKLVFQEPS